MKVPFVKLEEAAVRASYPIVGSLKGWFFRMNETSNGVWLVEGADLWGHTVSRQGDNPEALLQESNRDAANIARQLS